MTSGCWVMPITFPIAWESSKIPGFAWCLSVPDFHGISALTVFSSVAARFFAPQLGGAGASPSAAGGVFRIDHDERFNQTTHIQYQIGKHRTLGRVQLALRQRISGRAGTLLRR